MPTVVEPISSQDPRILPLLRSSFDHSFPHERLEKSYCLGHLTDDAKLVSIAVYERLSGHWYLWLFTVDQDFRSLGLGSELLQALSTQARHLRVPSLRVVTYAYWKKMRKLLELNLWFLEKIRVGEHHDGVAEEWRLLLSDTVPRILLVGATLTGRGAEYVQALKSNPSLGELVAVHDIDEEALDSWPSHLEKSTNLSLLVEKVKPDAAILALPHFAYQAIRNILIPHGIPMLHEKPLGITQEEILSLDVDLENSPVQIITGVQRRSHPSYMVLKQKIESRELLSLSIKMSLGRPAGEANTGWRSDRNKAGGGALIDIGYHAIDLAHFITGSQLDILSCTLSTQGIPTHEGELETAATIYGRCGATWVRIEIDRLGKKEEWALCDTAEGDLWFADREMVKQGDTTLYTCPRSWEKAEAGRLGLLALACQVPPSPPALNEHIHILKIIHRAYQQSSWAGLIHTHI